MTRKKSRPPALPKPRINNRGEPISHAKYYTTLKEKERLTALTRLAGKAYVADMLRAAVGVYAIFIEEHQKGRVWYSENADGTGRERLRMVEI